MRGGLLNGHFSWVNNERKQRKPRTAAFVMWHTHACTSAFVRTFKDIIHSPARHRNPNVSPVLISIFNPCLNPQTVLWICEDQSNHPHFAKRMSVLKKCENTHKTELSLHYMCLPCCVFSVITVHAGPQFSEWWQCGAPLTPNWSHKRTALSEAEK